MSGVRIDCVDTNEDFDEFARLPYRVYEDRVAWWPPDVQHEIDLLSGRTPLSPHLELMPLLARRNAAPIARVTAVVNNRYNQHWGEQLGQLIHFEAVAGEEEAAVAMLDQASSWLRQCGMKAARSGFAAFLDYPFAIDNRGELPSFLLRGNPGYYHCCFKNAGFVTEKGLLDYTVELTPRLLARYRDLICGARAAGLAISSWREYGFIAAIDAWTDVTNEAFERHWGWNPVTRAESRTMLAALAGTAVADLSVVATADGEPVGAVFSVPDFSTALAKLPPGTHVASDRGGGTRGALINIGVVKRARGRGVGVAMAARSFLAMAERRMRYAGYTLVLDDNWPSRSTAERLGGRVTSNFVAYRREL
jgi:GNAT superfamily N-acetyltransferase